MKKILRRLPFALFTLFVFGLITATGGLLVRQGQIAAGQGAVEAPGVPAAYGDDVASRARFDAELVYTSLDAPGSGEATACVSWDDAWFTQDETAYNSELAHTASVLAALAYSESGYYQAGNDCPPYMENALAKLGFTDVCTESYRYRSEVVDEVLSLVTNDADGVAYTIARKSLMGEGRPRDLILVSVRGSYGAEWVSNLDLSRNEEDDHGGYVRAAQEICREVGAWATESRAAGSEVSVLFVGHSRGGAVANLAAAEFDDALAGPDGADAGESSDATAAVVASTESKGDASSVSNRASLGGRSTDAAPERAGMRVYAYTFASPATTLNAEARSARYGNIFNIVNPSDIMPSLPLAAWGYERYGVDRELPAPWSEGFEVQDDLMRAAYERSVGVACGADAQDARTVRGVCEDLAQSVASAEDLVTPAGAMAVLTSVASRVDPVRILYSHYPSTYVAWLSVLR